MFNLVRTIFLPTHWQVLIVWCSYLEEPKQNDISFFVFAFFTLFQVVALVTFEVRQKI